MAARPITLGGAGGSSGVPPAGGSAAGGAAGASGNSGAQSGVSGGTVAPAAGKGSSGSAAAGTAAPGAGSSATDAGTGAGGDGTAGSMAGSSGKGGAGTMGGAGTAGSAGSAGSDPMMMDPDPMMPDPSAEIGSGDISKPVAGPAPVRATEVGGGKFVLVKNWDFGTGGTVKDMATLNAEFVYHDQFGTIANGTNYGAVTVAPSADLAINAPNLGLPGNKQPVEEAGRPYREFNADAIHTYVRTLSASQTNATVSKHDTGNGSFMAKWKLPKGGALLGKDLIWEVRSRMPKPAKAYWYAIWTAGNQWNKGAEMDVLESFGTPNIYPPAAAYHVNSVGGQDNTVYNSWPAALDGLKVPSGDRDLTKWHVWTWAYLKDDTFKVWMDGYVVQSGKIHWTLGGTQSGQELDLEFLFDLGWGHTQISDVNVTLPASDFPIEYEIDYSRVYLR